MLVVASRWAAAVGLVPAVMLAGCGGRPAMTPEEFLARQADTRDTLVVDRPLGAVAATFRERAKACIQGIQVTTVSGPPERRLPITWIYHETVTTGDGKAELIVQALNPQAAHLYKGQLPEDGIYVMLVRAYPVDGRRSRLEFFGSWKDWYEQDGTLKTAIRGWAAGTFAGCPELL